MKTIRKKLTYGSQFYLTDLGKDIQEFACENEVDPDDVKCIINHDFEITLEIENEQERH